MKIKNFVLALCLLSILGVPIKVDAAELGINVVDSININSEPKIEMLDPEDAERIYKEAKQNAGISTWSVMSTSDIVIAKGNNIIYVAYTTGSRRIADKVGARNVTLQEKTGLFWKTLTIESGYSENTDTHFGGFSMTNPVKGAQYRAWCTHYVLIGGQETSGYNETLAMSYP